MKTAIIILGFVFFIIYTIWFAFSSISRCYDNYFGIYKLFSEMRVNGKILYYAKVYVGKYLGIIPIWEKFYANSDSDEEYYWYSKEALEELLTKNFEFCQEYRELKKSGKYKELIKTENLNK